jgi:uncharacterized coiled-coil DUF342 family protein
MNNYERKNEKEDDETLNKLIKLVHEMHLKIDQVNEKMKKIESNVQSTKYQLNEVVKEINNINDKDLYIQSDDEQYVLISE